jgi:hypothetical protein
LMSIVSLVIAPTLAQLYSTKDEQAKVIKIQKFQKELITKSK